MKQRTSDDTTKQLKERRKQGLIDDFQIVRERKWGRVKDLLNNRPVLVRWDDSRLWEQQLFIIKIGKEEAIISRQELETYLRHV